MEERWARAEKRLAQSRASGARMDEPSAAQQIFGSDRFAGSGPAHRRIARGRVLSILGRSAINSAVNRRASPPLIRRRGGSSLPGCAFPIRDSVRKGEAQLSVRRESRRLWPAIVPAPLSPPCCFADSAVVDLHA